MPRSGEAIWMGDDNIVSLEGPIERLDGQLVLMIPLDAGGAAFAECARGISSIDGAFLRIEIPEWLAAKLRVVEGDHVYVDNAGGKFNIHPVAARPMH